MSDEVLSRPVYCSGYWSVHAPHVAAWTAAHGGPEKAWLQPHGEYLLWLAEDAGVTQRKLMQAAAMAVDAVALTLDLAGIEAPPLESWDGVRSSDHIDAGTPAANLHRRGHALHAGAYVAEAMAHLYHGTAHQARHFAQAVRCACQAAMLADFKRGRLPGLQYAQALTANLVRARLGAELPSR